MYNIPNHAKLYGLMSNKLIICCIFSCVNKVIIWWVSQSTWILSSLISTHHDYSSSIASAVCLSVIGTIVSCKLCAKNALKTEQCSIASYHNSL